MTNQVQIAAEHDVLDEPCPRCGSTAVHAVMQVEFAGEEPLFDCRECGFEWGELVRDLMR